MIGLCFPDDPKQDPNATGDPYRTLFISRLSYEATEADLKKEFDMYGPIEKLLIVKNKLTGKSRGYAFILFEREKDMKGKFLLLLTFSYFLLHRTTSEDLVLLHPDEKLLYFVIMESKLSFHHLSSFASALPSLLLLPLSLINSGVSTLTN